MDKRFLITKQKMLIISSVENISLMINKFFDLKKLSEAKSNLAKCNLLEEKKFKKILIQEKFFFSSLKNVKIKNSVLSLPEQCIFSTTQRYLHIFNKF
ncbi:hypothetical protein BpHYR1_052724 [Brachionus plicatilis]|uniref:Uncharacterized protein n=1 Tax=Brachionus plicatilis TaxID=10195 RepID=A0A3M7SJL8_BRAPC|nr:hypothetical protein BpHYR1_052724 [Brachionus plicatilis]